MNKSDKILHQVKTNYNKIAEHFSQTRSAPWAEFELFSEYIKEDQKILDLGSGNSRLYQYLKEKNFNIEYFGLDISERLVVIAQKKYPEIADKLKVSNITDLPYQDDQFDTVVSIATFHHLPNKALRLKALSEMWRVLKPGGHVLMTNWHLWHRPHLKYIFNQLFKKVSLKDFFIPWKSPDGQIQFQRFVHGFTRGELKGLFRQVGFKTEKFFLYQDQEKKDYSRKINVVAIGRKP